MNTDYKPPTLHKRATDDLPYVFSFATWSLLSTDTIASATVAGSPSGLTIGTPSVLSGGKQVQVRISGGTAGETYTVTCLAVTSGGYTITGDAYLEVVSP